MEEYVKKRRPQDWSAEEKFQAVMETANLNETELGAYCRRNGLHTQILEIWRETCLTSIRKGPRINPAEKALKKENKELKRDLRRKVKALAEATALLILKKSGPDLGGSRGRRGRYIDAECRQRILASVTEAMANGCPKTKACEALGVSVRTVQQWEKLEYCIDKRTVRIYEPEHKITGAEREEILRIVNSPQYRDMSPCQIVPALADEGQYIASESTIYRILREERMLQHRAPSRPAKHKMLEMLEMLGHPLF